MNFLVRIIGGLILGVAIAKIVEEFAKDENFEKKRGRESDEVMMAIDEQHSFEYETVKPRTAKTKVTKTIKKLIAENKAFKIGAASDLKAIAKDNHKAYKYFILLCESKEAQAITDLATHYIESHAKDKKNTNKKGEGVHIDAEADKHYLYMIAR